MKIKYINVPISFVFLLVFAPITDVMAARRTYKDARRTYLDQLPSTDSTKRAHNVYRNNEDVAEKKRFKTALIMHNGVKNSGAVNGRKVVEILNKKGFGAEAINAYRDLVKASENRVRLKAAKKDEISKIKKPSFLFLRGKKTKENFKQQKAAIEQKYDLKIAELKQKKNDSRSIIETEVGIDKEYIAGKKAGVNLAIHHYNLKKHGILDQAAKLKREFNARHIDPNIYVQDRKP